MDVLDDHVRAKGPAKHPLDCAHFPAGSVSDDSVITVAFALGFRPSDARSYFTFFASISCEPTT